MKFKSPGFVFGEVIVVSGSRVGTCTVANAVGRAATGVFKCTILQVTPGIRNTAAYVICKSGIRNQGSGIRNLLGPRSALEVTLQSYEGYRKSGIGNQEPPRQVPIRNRPVAFLIQEVYMCCIENYVNREFESGVGPGIRNQEWNRWQLGAGGVVLGLIIRHFNDLVKQ